MEEIKNEIAVETVFVIPHNQYYIGYKINEGVFHTIKKEEAPEYFCSFVSSMNYGRINFLLQRFLPFIIMVQDDRVIELKKKRSDTEYYSEQIKNEIFSKVTDGFDTFSIEEPERFSNENNLQKMLDKVIQK